MRRPHCASFGRRDPQNSSRVLWIWWTSSRPCRFSYAWLIVMISYPQRTQTFSSDSRWLITTSLDSIIRTFDIPSGHLIDAFRTASVATSISFSPTSDFLATAHVDGVGIYLWYVCSAASLAWSNDADAGQIEHSARTSRSAELPKRMLSVSTFHRCMAPPKTKVCFEIHTSCM